MQTNSIGSIVHRTRELVDEKTAAEILCTTPGTLSVWRSTGRYALPFLKIGRKVRYRISDLDAWLEQRTRASGATA
jgi:hypothetical protein